MLQNIIIGLVGLVTFVVGVLAISLLMLAGGAVVGWIAGWAFPTVAAKIMAATGLATYQWGAIVAFVGSYFRTTVTK